MIYSDDIEKKCALCVFAEPIKGNAEHMKCTKRNEYVGTNNDGCGTFQYDILKRKPRRRKINMKKFKPNDFEL